MNEYQQIMDSSVDENYDLRQRVEELVAEKQELQFAGEATQKKLNEVQEAAISHLKIEYRLNLRNLLLEQVFEAAKKWMIGAGSDKALCDAINDVNAALKPPCLKEEG